MAIFNSYFDITRGYLLIDASDAANVRLLSGCIGRCLSMIVVLNSRFLMTRLEMQHDWHQCHGHTNSHTQFCHVLSICLSFFPLVFGAIQPAHQVELMTRLNCMLSSRTIFLESCRLRAPRENTPSGSLMDHFRPVSISVGIWIGIPFQLPVIPHFSTEGHHSSETRQWFYVPDIFHISLNFPGVPQLEAPLFSAWHPRQETWPLASELLSQCPAAVLVSSALLMRADMHLLDAIRGLDLDGGGLGFAREFIGFRWDFNEMFFEWDINGM